MDNPPPPITEQIYDEQAIIAKASLDDRAKIEKKFAITLRTKPFSKVLVAGCLPSCYRKPRLFGATIHGVESRWRLKIKHSGFGASSMESPIPRSNQTGSIT